jgi:serine/threonine protein kinase
MAKTKKNYNKKRGGKVIASGGYGCVFNPALKCEGSSKREANKVSKLMTERHAKEEYEEINEIKNKLDPIPNYEDYFLIYDVTLCRPAKLQGSDLTAYSDKCTALPKDNITKKNINTKLHEVMSLNIPNGGLPIDDFIYENTGYDNLYKTHISLVNLLKKGIIAMNSRHIYHSDIKDSNILVDNSKSLLKTRLIDWGLTVEYVPQQTIAFPKKWRNRPLQFNVPFSVVIFTDLFYEKYSKYLKDGGKVEEATLKPFVIDYLNEWIKERGAGHYKFINEIMFLLYSNELKSISESNKPVVIETEITMPYIIDYIVDVLLHYTKFKGDGSLNLREYLDNVYIKIVDIWGFITAYYPLLEMFGNNYFNLKENELKIFKQLQHVFNEYLYTPRHEPIDIDELLEDLKILGNLIYNVAHGKRKTTSSISLSGGYKTKTRNTKKNRILPIFKKKPKQRRFKNPFFLSLK